MKQPILTEKPVAKPVMKVDPAANSPCNWHIKAEGDNVEAINTLIGDVFRGTLADFNRVLRNE